MKTTTFKILIVLFVATLLSSCNSNMFNSATGNRNVTIEDRTKKEPFTAMKVSSGLELYISQGSKNKITVEADENLHELIKTEVKDGVLTIYSEKNIWKAKARKIYVTIKEVEVVAATSGAEVYTKETLTVKNLTVSATSGAEINISVDADSIETVATSGADIAISGISNTHISKATSGASIDAFKLQSKNVTAIVTSGADINVYASEKMDGKATSGGDIDFKGNPKKINKTTTSGGSVSAE
ncbi:head GIN domain-containing protein [uncultured Polaribacter sp.]|uniref:head GIN domain-containing protein n=1 Tax=uncultured Polaribacter sp. TaxID=174711 RepID=UPI002779E03F|nr:DUF2807 domain-containing protein [Polaribacter sp.]|tara:strand:+ start:206 stop:931 length:726 start_codon:yes stop_codon:yes gene_type:complete